MSHILKLSSERYVVTLLYVTLQYIVNEIGNIFLTVLYCHQLRESAFLHILIKCLPLKGNALFYKKNIFPTPYFANITQLQRLILQIPYFFNALFYINWNRKDNTLTTAILHLVSQENTAAFSRRNRLFRNQHLFTL